MSDKIRPEKAPEIIAIIQWNITGWYSLKHNFIYGIHAIQNTSQFIGL